MREQVILAPGAGGTELTRTLARFGVNTLGLRVMGAPELAKTALTRAGVSLTEGFLTKREEPAVIFSFLRGVPYFGAASYADAENLADALDTVRGFCIGDERSELANRLSGGGFPAKNDAILQVYDRYMQECQARGLIDSIGLIRRGIEAGTRFDAEFTLLREYPVTPLERSLIETLSGGAVPERSLADLFPVGKAASSEYRFTEAYGTVNEAESILSEIIGSGTPLDEVTVACAAPSAFGQVIYDLAGQYEIPVTYGSGVPIVNALPAELLRLMAVWDTTGHNGIDALRALLTSAAFDRRKLKAALKTDSLQPESLCAMAGSLRISFDAAANRERISACRAALKDQRELDLLALTEKLAHELEKGFTAFFEKYAVIRAGQEQAGRIDRSALEVISESLRACTGFMPDAAISDIVPELLRKTVCSEGSRPGALHIVSIPGAMASLRKSLYLCGLSAAEFPGSPKENYLLLDKDLAGFGAETEVPTSVNRIRRKRDGLSDLLRLADRLGVAPRFSYSGYDLATLKEQNPSSVLFTLYAKSHSGCTMEDFRNALESVGYFQSTLSDTRLVGNAYAFGGRFRTHPPQPVPVETAGILDRAWSPSALEIFFACPRRFYLTKVLGIPEEEPDDPFEVIGAAELGTLTHTMMEALAAKPRMPEADFLNRAGQLFDEFLLSRPPLHPQEAVRERKEFLSMMGSAYRLDPGHDVEASEAEVSGTHPSGVKLHGRLDRLERDGNGGYLIADFKTGRRMNHVENDIDTCLQAVIYAWLCEQAGKPVTRCEYRYLRKKLTVTCVYNDSMKAKLDAKLMQFRNAVDSMDFPRSPGDQKENCRFCRLSRFCDWEGDEVKKIAEEAEKDA